ncbi:hypothetical protein [Bacteroides acidifaciens]|jgi:hypothetical protein|uniref:hypothetical protein n=1 Tax=Bacteroides acidifaciens TaxID=85831 RepID=UPI0025B3FBEC|nr:hypothetical protein [Bacteroides acidifaciens]
MAMRKTKSGHGSDCGFGGGFSEKKESRNISLHSFFLIVIMTIVSVMTVFV